LPWGPGGNRGQGAIEYILLLLVVVGIIVGLLLQFNQAFATYTKALLGDYVICLLENGELPGLGLDDNGQSQCSQTPLAFSASAANGAGGSSGSGGNSASGGSSSSGSNGGGTSGSSGGSGAKKNSAGGSGSGSSASSGRAGDIHRTGDSFLQSSGGRQRRVALAGAEGDPESTSSTGKLEMGKGGGRGRGENKSGTDKGGRVVAMSSRFDTSSLDDRDQGKRVALGPTEERDLKPRRLRVEPSAKKTAAAQDEDSRFSLGDLFRYIIIAAIVIVLVIFIGGQALQASKSMEKG
jgi:hypothetical protein